MFRGIFANLTDRGISKQTAESSGVKVVYDSAGQLIKYIYPFYINNEHVPPRLDM